MMQGILTLLWALLLAGSVCLYADSAAGSDPPGLGGWAGYVVEDAAMEPELASGDLAVIKKGADAKPGDMVLCREGERAAVTRIIGTTEGQMILQADNSGESRLAQPGEIEGVCTTYLPGFGPAFRFLSSIPGIASVGLLGLLLIVLPGFLLRAPKEQSARPRKPRQGGYTARH